MKGIEMRYIADCNPNKRGCDYCANVEKCKFWVERERKFVTRKVCPYDECPYTELDHFKTYAEYDKYAKRHGNRNLETWLKKIFSLS